jgi:predicted Zn finger-like uncharacterized protein
MIVQCPQCETKFNLPDEKVKPEGVKVRCSRCRHVFTAEPPQVGGFDDLFPAKDQAPEGGPQNEPARRVLDDESWQAPETPADESLSFSFPGLEKKAPPELAPEPQAQAPAKERPAEKPEKAGEHKLGLDLEDTEELAGVKPRRAKSRLPLILAALAFLVLGSLGAAYFLDLLPDSLNRTLTNMGLPAKPVEVTGQPEKDAQPPAEADAVSQIALENVRQYNVANEKAGRLIVIEGKAVNNFPAARDHVAVEATLFDAGGTALVTKNVLCGNVLSYFQLQILSRTEIETALSAESGVLANNTNIQPGQGAPFMIVFFEPPAGVAEFGVKVADSKPLSGK